MKPQKNNLDQLALQLFRNYSDHLQNDDQVSPYFTSRVWQRIAKEQHLLPSVWAIEVISARRWLIALTVIALLFFAGNLIAIRLQSGFPLSTQSSVLDDSDYISTEDEAFNLIGLQKE